MTIVCVVIAVVSSWIGGFILGFRFGLKYMQDRETPERVWKSAMWEPVPIVLSELPTTNQWGGHQLGSWPTEEKAHEAYKKIVVDSVEEYRGYDY